MSELYLIYFDETGTEYESVPFQGHWSDWGSYETRS